MGIGPTIQDLSPAYVVKVLMQEPCGTYIVRSSVPNDDIISSVKMSNQSTSSARDRYVVLSVRVSDRKNPSPIMNYRLTFTGENLRQLLKQHDSQKNKLEKFTPLRRELIVSSTNPDWIIDRKQFSNIKFGEGRFGGKYNDGAAVVTWRKSGQDNTTTFIKRFSKKRVFYENELNILKQLCFFSIIPLYGHYSDHSYNYLVFPHSGRSLKSISPIKNGAGELNMPHICKIAFQIANAMVYLEKKNIVHRDLTASNVLLDDYGFIRIVDFGHAIQIIEGKNNLTSSSPSSNEQKEFQTRFLAPECMTKYMSFSSKSDVWAFGILLIELMIDKNLQPYPHIKKDDDIPPHIRDDHKMHPIPDGCNNDFYLILQQCWVYEPKHRIPFTEIREKMNMLVSIFS